MKPIILFFLFANFAISQVTMINEKISGFSKKYVIRGTSEDKAVAFQSKSAGHFNFSTGKIIFHQGTDTVYYDTTEIKKPKKLRVVSKDGNLLLHFKYFEDGYICFYIEQKDVSSGFILKSNASDTLICLNTMEITGKYEIDYIEINAEPLPYTYNRLYFADSLLRIKTVFVINDFTRKCDFMFGSFGGQNRFECDISSKKPILDFQKIKTVGELFEQTLNLRPRRRFRDLVLEINEPIKIYNLNMFKFQSVFSPPIEFRKSRK